MSSAPTFADEFNLADYFVHDRLKEGRGDRVALRFGDRSFTYAQVSERSRGFAASLRAHGVSPEQRVLVVLPDLPPFAWAIMGTLEAGAVLAMGNPDAPAKDLAYLLEYTRATAIVAVPRVLEALAGAITASSHLRVVFVVPDASTDDDPCAPVPLPSFGALAVRALEDEVTARRPGSSPRDRRGNRRPRSMRTGTLRSTPRCSRSRRSVCAKTTSR
jgi:acyl-CoA synthetase (AMP-forming)/AMP-acid ligase II